MSVANQEVGVLTWRVRIMFAVGQIPEGVQSTAGALSQMKNLETLDPAPTRMGAVRCGFPESIQVRVDWRIS